MNIELSEDLKDQISVTKDNIIDKYRALQKELDQPYELTYTNESMRRVPEVMLRGTQEVGKAAMGLRDLKEARRQREYAVKRRNSAEAMGALATVAELAKFIRLFL